MIVNGGALLIWNDIAAGDEDAFRQWHDQEHIPERLGVPGFLYGRRLFRSSAWPRWLTFYEAENVSVFSSPAYLARLDAPTPGTKAILPSFRATQRMAGTVVAAAGDGRRGGTVATARVWPREESQSAADPGALESTLQDIALHDGILSAAIVVSDAGGTMRMTAERSLRTPDETPPGIVMLVEAEDAGPLPDLTAAAEALFPHAERIAVDQYAVEFALGRDA
ncbi:MAG: hypothetical protein KDJ88_06995 [Bauldia sp.]|nr:hypothetical protein [Bauldia sp.]